MARQSKSTTPAKKTTGTAKKASPPKSSSKAVVKRDSAIFARSSFKRLCYAGGFSACSTSAYDLSLAFTDKILKKFLKYAVLCASFGQRRTLKTADLKYAFSVIGQSIVVEIEKTQRVVIKETPVKSLAEQARRVSRLVKAKREILYYSKQATQDRLFFRAKTFKDHVKVHLSTIIADLGLKEGFQINKNFAQTLQYLVERILLDLISQSYYVKYGNYEVGHHKPLTLSDKLL